MRYVLRRRWPLRTKVVPLLKVVNFEQSADDDSVTAVGFTFLEVKRAKILTLDPSEYSRVDSKARA